MSSPTTREQAFIDRVNDLDVEASKEAWDRGLEKYIKEQEEIEASCQAHLRETCSDGYSSVSDEIDESEGDEPGAGHVGEIEASHEAHLRETVREQARFDRINDPEVEASKEAWDRAKHVEEQEESEASCQAHLRETHIEEQEEIEASHEAHLRESLIEEQAEIEASHEAHLRSGE